MTSDRKWSGASWAVYALCALALHGCSEDGKSRGALTCGGETCQAHELCDETLSPASCVCASGYAGDNCSACVPGYMAQGDRCAPVAIDCNTKLPCGAQGKCIESSSGDRCECSQDRTGPTCEQCVAGLQDNDRNGTCTTSCSGSSTQCASWERCDDSKGAISCGCAPHATGRHCDECESGYYRLADGPCVKECDYKVSCSAPQSCKEVESADAACSCPLGASGSACNSCTAGFTAVMGGACGREPRPGRLLIASADMNWDLLSELDLTSGTSTPLRSGVPYLLFADPVTHELWAGEYASSGVVFGRYDLPSGKIDPLRSSRPFTSSTTFDSTRRAIYWVAANALDGLEGQLMRLELQSGKESAIGATLAIRSGDFMAYDAARDRLIATRWNMGLELVALHPETGELTVIGKPAVNTNLTNPRIAVAQDGQIYLLSSVPRAAAEALRDMLAEVAVRLGMPAVPESAPVRLEHRYWADATMPITLSSAQTSGSEVIAYDSHGDLQSSSAAPGITPLTVKVENPDALLSITTLKENLRIQIQKQAKFKSLLIYAGRQTVLEIEAGFTAPAGTIRIIGSNIDQPALEALSPSIRAYSAAAVEGRRARVDAYYDDSDDSPPTWLIRVDPATLAATLVRRMDPVHGSSLLVAY